MVHVKANKKIPLIYTLNDIFEGNFYVFVGKNYKIFNIKITSKRNFKLRESN